MGPSVDMETGSLIWKHKNLDVDGIVSAGKYTLMIIIGIKVQ